MGLWGASHDRGIGYGSSGEDWIGVFLNKIVGFANFEFGLEQDNSTLNIF